MAEAPFWAPFVPREVAEDLLRGPGPAVGRSRTRDILAMFADLSGFTALAEALAGRPHGAEELTELLNRVFDPLVRRISASGGQTTRFNGDAITAIFPITDDPRGTAREAFACAIALQAWVTAHSEVQTANGTVRLAIKIGLARGQALIAVVGDPRLHLEALVAGPAIDACAEAEHAASPGQIVLHGSLTTLLRPSDRPEPAVELVDPPLSGDHPDGAAFLHPVVASRVRSGNERFVQEHRLATVAFVRLPEVDLADLPGLQRLAETVVRTVDRWGGAVDKLDAGDKGMKALLVFGAPVAHEDDVDRALRCLLELREAGVALGAGVHLGRAFFGVVGPPERREYTAIGDVVNVAARLMQLAGERVVASPEVALAAAGRFGFTPLDAVTLKGKSAPIRPFRLDGQAVTTRRAVGPLVGRRAELGLVERALAGAVHDGRAVIVTGDAGFGKTRFLEAAVDQARARGFAVHLAEADAAAASDPWRALRPWWRSLAGAAAPGPALGPLLGEPDEGGELPPALRKSRREAAVVALLAAAGERRPLLLAVDDAHGLDAASIELLAALIPRLPELRVALVVAGRSAPALPEGRHVLRIGLGGLSPAEARAVAERELRQRHLPIDLAAAVAERSGGNPLFVGAIVGLLALRGGSETDLPGSVRAILTSRLDALPEDRGLLVRYACVHGRRFRVPWLAGAHPELGSPEAVAGRLAGLSAEEITEAADSDEHSFRHGLLQEVAYENLARATRSGLHERLAAWLAASEGVDPAVVAHHYGASDDLHAQATWFLRAAEAAELAGAPGVALGWWERLAAIANPVDRGPILLKLGAAAEKAGRWDRAESAWTEALGDSTLAAKAERALGGLAVSRGLLDPAERWLTAARSRSHDDAAWVDATAALAHVLLARRAPERALELLAEALPTAERLGGVALATVLSSRGVLWQGPEPARAQADLARALTLVRAAGDRSNTCKNLGNLGVLALRLGDLVGAASYFRDNFALAGAIGDARSRGIAVGNLGAVYGTGGDAPRALACFAAQLQNFLLMDDRRTLATCLLNAGAMRLLTRGPEASGVLALSAALARAFPTPGLLAVVLGIRARELELRGDEAAAAAVAIEAVQAIDPSTPPDAAADARLLATRLGVLPGPALLALLALPTPTLVDRARRSAAIARVDATQVPAAKAACLAAIAERTNLWTLLDLRALGGDLPPALALGGLPEGVDPHPDLDALFARIEPIARRMLAG